VPSFTLLRATLDLCKAWTKLPKNLTVMQEITCGSLVLSRRRWRIPRFCTRAVVLSCRNIVTHMLWHGRISSTTPQHGKPTVVHTAVLTREYSRYDCLHYRSDRGLTEPYICYIWFPSGFPGYCSDSNGISLFKAITVVLAFRTADLIGAICGLSIKVICTADRYVGSLVASYVSCRSNGLYDHSKRKHIYKLTQARTVILISVLALRILASRCLPRRYTLRARPPSPVRRRLPRYLITK
jgi:hypothetical protein